MEHIRQLTDLQMAVMNVLWDRKEATVAQVHTALQEQRDLAPTTVATLLSRLEKYGVIAHCTRGRQYVYYSLVSRGEVRQNQVVQLVNQFFQGNPTDLVCHLLSETPVDAEDLARIMALIASNERADDDDDQ